MDTVVAEEVVDLVEQIRGLAKSTHATFKKPINKVLCANRGEIAIRVFRAAHELGLNTVAIYSHDDRLTLHRYRADESYEVGKGKSPVSAYLDIESIIKICKDHDVDAIHPGYGFLSENAEFARAVVNNGMIWIGPRPEVIDKMGDKVAARNIAGACKVPCIPGTTNCKTVEQAQAFVSEVGCPVIVKAAFGGGGRGMRVINAPNEVAECFNRATSEALTAFGNGTVFLEKYLKTPRHIEVQLLGDEQGNLIHLYERDCSVQRRHQKVVEIAPAQQLDPKLREMILADALKIAKHVGYSNAGTAEFLVQDNKHYFIEVNPRIQVEHTVTEEITGVDLVCSQICIAAGCSLADLNLSQQSIVPRGCAIQCRITTEDPHKGFQPDTGRLDAYRSSGGPGVRLDSSTTAGRVITPHYDSMLVKITCRAGSYKEAVLRLLRAITEFRIRGVKTNMPFLQKVLTHPKFVNGAVTTKFIDETPELFIYNLPDDRATKALAFLGDLLINGVDLPVDIKGSLVTPEAPVWKGDGTQRGWRDIFLSEGPKAFAAAVRKHKGCLLMDTTWRDAHQSLLATRMRTIDIARVAKFTSHALQNAFALEMWGGATFDVALRFLHECPWERLRLLRKLVPHIPFQMLLRGANAVGYTAYPDNVVYEFVRLAKENGIDVFRVFDSLNDVENLKLGLDAVIKAGGICEATLCYTGDVLRKDPGYKYNLQYYVKMADQLVELGAHMLCIKDMAGLLKPPAATLLVSTLRKRFPDVPIHVHTHDTAGSGVASMIACAQAGADVVDAATDAMSGLTSQPSMGALVAALESTNNTGIKFEDLVPINDYWEQVRLMYAAFESPDLRSGNSDVYLHEMPGGQYTNLQFQASSLGLGHEWPRIKKAYAMANQLLGDIVKVTPSSKVAGDLAQFMVQNNLDEAGVRAQAATLSFPSSVVQYFQGQLGQPAGGIPKDLQRAIVKDLKIVKTRPGAEMKPFELAKKAKELNDAYGKHFQIRPEDIISAALYPQVFDEYCKFKVKYGDVSVIPTPLFLNVVSVGKEFSLEIEQGKLLFIKLLAIGRALPDGTKQVFWELNGNARAIAVKDNKASATVVSRPKADITNPGSVGAPMSGVVIDIRVKKDQNVLPGDPLAVLSAMKMETVVSSPIAGKVTSVSVKIGDSLAAQDLIVTLAPSLTSKI